MADGFGARQQVADSLSFFSVYQDTAVKLELTQPLGLGSATTLSPNDYIPPQGRFNNTQKPIKLAFVNNGPHETDDETC